MSYGRRGFRSERELGEHIETGRASREKAKVDLRDEKDNR